MSSPKSFRAVYKTVGSQEIDVDIYLPGPAGNESKPECPVLLNFHGGAFMLGSSKMVNKDQIQDCIDRGWIVLAPNHRLSPQVNILEGPIQDSRDLLEWIYSGELQGVISSSTGTPYLVDLDHVFAFGTSAGGTLALCLGFGVPRPVAGIYDMYGPCVFHDPSWKEKLPHIALSLPEFPPGFIDQVFDEDPVPIEGGLSLEGQRKGGPDFTNPRQAYVSTQLANGTVLDAVYPSGNWDEVDPIKNLSPFFPPTFIAHGADDRLVPPRISEALFSALSQHGVKCDLRIIPEEDHIFTGTMKVGSQTWNLQREGFDFLESLIQHPKAL
ncbi:hypothetical protein FDECE_13741 [Fusarium decemcellulare]|nr:hypothetical protein FDECE_13741 [Fusarium decemcellulare]